MVYLGTPWVVSRVPIQQVAKSLPPASPQDSFSAAAGGGQPSAQWRTGGVARVMAGHLICAGPIGREVLADSPGLPDEVANVISKGMIISHPISALLRSSCISPCCGGVDRNIRLRHAAPRRDCRLLHGGVDRNLAKLARGGGRSGRLLHGGVDRNHVTYFGGLLSSF
jgi:hypothetical protein